MILQPDPPLVGNLTPLGLTHLPFNVCVIEKWNRTFVILWKDGFFDEKN